MPISRLNKEIKAHERKALRGDADAMYSLAVIHHLDAATMSAALPLKLLDRGFESAIEWAKKAMEEGHPWASLLLGHIYSHSKFKRRDLKTALRYYKISSKLGVQHAAELIPELRSEIQKNARAKQKAATRIKRDLPTVQRGPSRAKLLKNEM